MATADLSTPTGRPSLRYCVIDVQPVRSGHPVGRVARTGFWLSLFRFQGATGHIPVLPVVVPGARRTVPDRLLRWRVSFGGQKASRGRSDGMHTVSDRPSHRQRVDCRRDETGLGGHREGCGAGVNQPAYLPADLPGASTQATWTRFGPKDATWGTKPHPRILPAGDGRLTVPRQNPGQLLRRRAAPCRGTTVHSPLRHRLWRAKSPLDPSHATRRSKLNRLSAPPLPSPWDRPGGACAAR